MPPEDFSRCVRDDDLPLKRKADCCNDRRSRCDLRRELRSTRGWSAAVQLRRPRGRVFACGRLATADIGPEGAVLLPQVRDPQCGEFAIGPSESACGTLEGSLRRLGIDAPIVASACDGLHQSRFFETVQSANSICFVPAARMTRWVFTRRQEGGSVTSKFRDESRC